MTINEFGHLLHRINDHYSYIQQSQISTEERNHAYRQMYELLNDPKIISSKVIIPVGRVLDIIRENNNIYFKIGNVWMKIECMIFPIDRCYITGCYVYEGVTYIVYQDGLERKTSSYNSVIEILEDFILPSTSENK